MTQPSDRARKATLIDAIISAYHTTRLIDTPAAMHILSKSRVQEAFATFERDTFAAGVEAAARVAASHKPDRKHPLSAYDVDDRIEIRAEERGESIAASIIAAAIRNLTPAPPAIYGDGIRDDTPGLQALVDSKRAEGLDTDALVEKLAKADIAERRATIEQIIHALLALKAENDGLREALVFYADPANWQTGGQFMPASPHCEYRPDAGDTARAILCGSGEAG